MEQEAKALRLAISQLEDENGIIVRHLVECGAKSMQLADGETITLVQKVFASKKKEISHERFIEVAAVCGLTGLAMVNSSRLRAYVSELWKENDTVADPVECLPDALRPFVAVFRKTAISVRGLGSSYQGEQED